MQKTLNNILFSQFISIIYYAAKTAVQKNPSDYDKNNYYVFLVNKSEKGKKNGIMFVKTYVLCSAANKTLVEQSRKQSVSGQFNRHFGFMFMENNSGPLSEAEVQHTIAHELGHGAFTLYHPFSTKDKGITQGSTFNLMDYTTKQPDNLLRKYQWYIIHNPRLSLFGGDEEETSSDNVSIDKFLTWIKNNHRSDISYNKTDFYINKVWGDKPLKTKVNGKKITVYVELGDNGTIDINKNIDINVNPTLKYHTGFHIFFRYSNSDNTAIKIWTYKYDDFLLLLSKIGFQISDAGKKEIKSKYLAAINNQNKNCNVIDVIYETIPDFVFSSISDDQLYSDLVKLSNCEMTQNEWFWGNDTNEELAAINILKGVNSKLEFYNKLTSDYSLVKRLYSKINGSNRKSFIFALQDIISEYWKANNININDFSVNTGNINDDYYFFWNSGILNHGKFNDSGNKIELWGTTLKNYHSNVSFIPPSLFVEPFDPVVMVWVKDPNSSSNTESLLPAIYVKWMADEQGFEEGLNSIQLITNLIGIYGAGKILITGTTKLAKFIALLEGANIITSIIVNNSAVETKLRESKEGRRFLEVWPYISITADITTISVASLNKFINSSSKARAVFNEVGEHSDEVSKLDELVDEARRLANRRVDGRVEGLFESIDPAYQPKGITFVDTEKTYNGIKKVVTQVGKPENPDLHFIRQYDANNNLFIFNEGFVLNKDFKWISDVKVPLVQGKGIPSQTYITLRQMKMMGIPKGSLKKAKMSTLQNAETLSFVKKYMNSTGITDINQIGNKILEAPSISYVKTTLQQAGYKISAAKIVENNAYTLKIKEADWIDEFDEALLNKYGLDWDTELYIDFDIYLELVPIK